MDTIKLSEEDKAKNKRYGRAMGMVRRTYKIPVEKMYPLAVSEVHGIESGKFFCNFTAQVIYSLAIDIDLAEFTDKVNANVAVLEQRRKAS